jgi:hypothetical protein
MKATYETWRVATLWAVLAIGYGPWLAQAQSMPTPIVWYVFNESSGSLIQVSGSRSPASLAMRCPSQQVVWCSPGL